MTVVAESSVRAYCMFFSYSKVVSYANKDVKLPVCVFIEE